jgi:hypothetical protein
MQVLLGVGTCINKKVNCKSRPAVKKKKKETKQSSRSDRGARLQSGGGKWILKFALFPLERRTASVHAMDFCQPNPRG